MNRDCEGALWLWGSSRHHQLGGIENVSKKNAVLEPQAFPMDDRVISVSMGEGHTLYVTSDFEVFSMGRGREGQLGHGNCGSKANAAKPKPIQSLGEESVVDVCCGALHSMCRTTDGKVYMWGLVHQGTSLCVGGPTHRAAAGDARQMLGLGQENTNDTLQRIVKNSTARWLSATEEEGIVPDNDGDSEEEAVVDEGIVNMDATRIRNAVPIPFRATSLEGINIIQLAAGYGHNLALANDGRVFSCGYNDRGQLGLGHRINCAEFQQIKRLKGVMQVACGQQHCLARTYSGTMVWGNGALGQLGLGRTVTSRRVPACLGGNLSKRTIVDISAGGNHSVAVCEDGIIWTWGHGEYGQHGGHTSVSANDLVDAFFYYEPQQLKFQGSNEVRFVEAKCGSCFSLARSVDGNVYSWGWNGHGVLGHDQGYFSHAPMRIQKLGGQQRKVLCLVAGSNHCGAVVHTGVISALSYRYLLTDNTHYDVTISVEGHSEVFKAHRVVLESRCRFLKGYLDAAHEARDIQRNSKTGSDVVMITLPLPATVLNVRALLFFIYTDRLDASAHVCKSLGALATYLYLPRLEALCKERRHQKFGCIIPDQSNAAREIDIPDSTLENDMGLFLNNRRHANVRVIVERNGAEFTCIWAHSCILERFEYFRSLLSGNFKEASHREMCDVDMTNLLHEGIQFSTLQAIFEFIYTGSNRVVPIEDPTAITELAVVAERFGIQKLVRICERHLIEFLALDDRENAAECMIFASRYNLSRLAAHSRGVINYISHEAKLN